MGLIKLIFKKNTTDINISQEIKFDLLSFNISLIEEK